MIESFLGLPRSVPAGAKARTSKSRFAARTSPRPASMLFADRTKRPPELSADFGERIPPLYRRSLALLALEIDGVAEALHVDGVDHHIGAAERGEESLHRRLPAGRAEMAFGVDLPEPALRDVRRVLGAVGAGGAGENRAVEALREENDLFAPLDGIEGPGQVLEPGEELLDVPGVPLPIGATQLNRLVPGVLPQSSGPCHSGR